MARRQKPNEQNVFMNVPFDKGYERQFVALIAALLALGRKPRCVLEFSERGEGRLHRIQKHLESCRISIHDLSRVGVPVRFNMPFELGLACGLARDKVPHDFIILEKEPHRLDKTLSDIKGHDPYIHKGSKKEIINCILDALGSSANNPEPTKVYRLSDTLWKVATELKRKTGRDKLYSRSMFHSLVSAGLELAVDDELIEK